MEIRGSEWRKWDLHVHTPDSIENNYKSKGEQDKWERYISELEALPLVIIVLGINDYLFLDGYRKVLNYKTKGRLTNIELILPVLEFRLARFCGSKQFKRINYHIIFSNELSPDVIEQQFLNALSSSYKLDPDSRQTTWNGVITKDNLIRLGEEIIKSAPPEKRSEYASPLKEGFYNLNIEISDIEKALKQASSFFDGKYLTAIGKTEWDELKWDDSSIAEKKTIINNVDFIFTAAESVEKYKEGKETLSKQDVKDLLLDCSDAHSNIDSENKDRLGNCFTWIKSDPTFLGLKQVLIEPRDRIFVGDVPPLLNYVEKNRTKYIKKLTISKKGNVSEALGTWFENIELYFNKELTAVIGNKGNGKSAIADIIAHCCNVQQQEHFSFLHKNKFRKDELANNFFAKVHLEDDTELSKDNLGEVKNIDNTEPYVKYLPQGYFESICNDLQKEENLKNEIEQVVFQYIDTADRLGASNFKELIDKKTNLIESEIQELKIKLSLVNKDIIFLERKENAKYKEWIQSEILKKENEIRALLEPAPISKPDNSTPEIQKILKEIDDKKSFLSSIDKKIETAKQEKQQLSEKIINIDSIISRIQYAKNKVDELKSEIKDYITKLGLNIDELINLSSDISNIERIKQETISSLKKIESILSESILEPNNLYYQKKVIEQKLKEKQQLLQGPELEYQQYLKKKKEYEERKKEIEGSELIPNSLIWFKKEELYIENRLSKDIEAKTEERNNIVKNIYDKKQEVIDIYRKVKEKIDEKIDENSDLLDSYNIKIEPCLLIKHNFCEEFLSYIKQNVKGSFKGKTDGEVLIKETVAKYNIQTSEGMLDFCERLIYLLKNDISKSDDKRFVEEQTDNIQGLYDYIFSLDYISCNYQLKQNEKELSLLSPGEKGALLLIFYLLLDMDNKPLILDQPEDNLDNDSVANILVDFIKKAKKKRQIIMVTHNPNLAVVADAELVVYVKIDKKDNCKFLVESGSIEDPQTNKHIVDVLEGAMPAFRKRDNKYIWNG